MRGRLLNIDNSCTISLVQYMLGRADQKVVLRDHKPASGRYNRLFERVALILLLSTESDGKVGRHVW